MELVRGIPINRFCDEHNLSTGERLNLFIQVCHAVQHAHQKGIIHRDIKPSNILVTINDGVPVPKVIDFGIAKATAGRLTDRTLFTAFEQFIGTPAYMSPEQAQLSSLDVDTRSDIYSLGVLLYELLTGRTPFETKELLQAGLDEIRRYIREVEPPKPSTRLSTLEREALTTTAHHRATEPPKLIHLVHGDLDWIVMRCLEKNRSRRYETANALADDLVRHLTHRPIVARRPDALYRGRKFVRRNRQVLITAGSALLVGLVVGVWLYRQGQPAAPPRRAPTGVVAEVTTAPTGAAEKVGLLGEPEALVFTGNSTFSARAIREGLEGDDAFHLAAHPEAPLGEFMETTRQAIVRGYRGLGFPDATVSAQANRARQRLEVAIVEGPRFVCGDVHVQGAGQVSRDDIVRAVRSPAYDAPDPLTTAVNFVLAGQKASLTPVPSANPSSAGAGSGAGPKEAEPCLFTWPLVGPDTGWVAGRPASVTTDNLDAIRGAVHRLLDARGFPLADVAVHINPDRATGRASLELDVREGFPTVVGSIAVHGNHRNTAEEIVQCAGLAAGMNLDSRLLSRAKVALWNSARFYAFGIDLRPAAKGSRLCDVDITVEESEAMPPLHEALQRQQAALVRFANWMTAEAARGELDVLVSDPRMPEFTVALTPEALAIFTEGARDGSLLALLGRANGVRLFAGTAKDSAGIDLVRWNGHGTVFCRLVTTPAAVDPVHRANFSIGYGVVRGAGADSDNPAPIVISPLIACQYLAPKAAPAFANGEVVLGQSLGAVSMQIRFREATGELIEWTAVPVVDPSVAKAGDVVPRVSIRVGGSELTRIAGRVDRDWARLPYDPAQRRSLADVLLQSGLAERFSATPAAGRLLNRAAAVIRIAERVFAAPETRSRLDWESPPGALDFPIPPDPRSAGTQNGIVAAIGQMTYAASRVLGPPTTWPARIGRELSYCIVGESGHTGALLDDLDRDPDMGPIGSLVTARLLRTVDSPQAWRFARRTLERGSLADFRTDYEILLAGDSAVARLVRQTLPAMAALSDPELDAITGGLPAGDVQLAREALTTLRGVKAEGVAAVLRPVCENWWNHQMRPGLAARICVILGCDKVADPTAVAAIVNGAPLSRKMLALGRRQPGLIANLPSPLSAPLFADSQQSPNDPTLDALATLMLAEQEAVRQGADLSDAAADRGVEDFIRDQCRGDRSAFQAMLAREGVPLADFRELRRLDDGLSFLKGKLATEAATPTEAGIASAPAAPGTPRPADSATPGHIVPERARVVGELTAQKQSAALQDRLNRLRAAAFVYAIPAPAAVQAP